MHAFEWAADSRAIYFATRQPQTKEEKAAQKKEWKDVIRYRESERGDEIFRVDVTAVAAAWQSGATAPKIAPTTREISKIGDSVKELAVSADGARIAFCTDSRSGRDESLDDYSIFAIDLAGAGNSPVKPQLVSHAGVIYERIRWAKDNRHIFFMFLYGSVDGRVSGCAVAGVLGGCGSGGWRACRERARATFALGARISTERWREFDILSSGDLVAAGQLRTETQLYTQSSPNAEVHEARGIAGNLSETFRRRKFAARRIRLLAISPAGGSVPGGERE